MAEHPQERLIERFKENLAESDPSLEHLQTHISHVFLTGSWAYKVKKPMNFGFLDFSTLDRRRHFCEEELRLNARLAPELYDSVLGLDADGKLVTESLRDFTRRALKKRFASLDDFLRRWNEAERKQAIVDELENEGLPLDPILDELGKDLDPFDLICHVAFGAKPLTRRERAENVKNRDVFARYGDQARAVLDALLTKYADEGMFNLDDTNVLRIPPLDRLGTPVELVNAFGGKPSFEQAIHDLQHELYREPA